MTSTNLFGFEDRCCPIDTFRKNDWVDKSTYCFDREEDNICRQYDKQQCPDYTLSELDKEHLQNEKVTKSSSKLFSKSC